MYQKIIVGYDGSEQSDDALAFAQMLGGAFDAKLKLVEVMPYEPLLSELTIGPPTTLAAQRASTRGKLDRLARSLDIQAEAVESPSPARGLHEAAEKFEADVIVVGSSSRGSVGRVLAGSVGRRLLNGAPCAVAVAPRRYSERGQDAPRCIGVGFDGSSEAKVAMEAAAALAGRLDASLCVIKAVAPINLGYSGAWVVADPELEGVRHEQAERELDEVLASLPAGLRAEGRVLHGDPTRVLVTESGGDLDLLFVGSRGYGRIRGVLLGSVSAEVIGCASFPVVVVPRGVESPHASADGEATAVA